MIRQPSPLQSPEVRKRILRGMPSLIDDGFTLPRKSVQSALTRIVESISDLQRRSG